jgi:nickel-dependent lactate racemase
MIDKSHWLAAQATVLGTIGIKETPVRAMIHKAASQLTTPVTLAALTVDGHEVSGIVVGDVLAAWDVAAEWSRERHIRWCDRPYQRVLSCCPPMYNELWTAGKAMYKLEPVVALGGELIIYAPHLDAVSVAFDRYLYQIGYHVLPYFLADWQRYRDIPLGVIAHSTHVRGSGKFENGVEKPNVRVTLASKIPPEDCTRLNLGYMDPNKIDVADWRGREDEGVLLVPRAGEILYRLKGE